MELSVKLWRNGLLSGLLLALIVAIPPTYLDWKLNPGGLFQNASSTQWLMVFETLFRWIWPVFLITTFIVVLIQIRTSKRGS